MINDAARSVGPNPAAHARTSVWRVTASNWRMLDQVNARSHVPIVDGARTWSNSTGAAPALSTSTSSMLSPPDSRPNGLTLGTAVGRNSSTARHFQRQGTVGYRRLGLGSRSLPVNVAALALSTGSCSAWRPRRWSATPPSAQPLLGTRPCPRGHMGPLVADVDVIVVVAVGEMAGAGDGQGLETLQPG